MEHDSPSSQDQRLVDAARQQAMPTPIERPDRSPSLSESSVVRSIPGYELLREVHRGGQGTVFLALQLTTNRKVAIKLMHTSAIGSGGGARARFEREVQILGQLHHSNIVKVFDRGVTEAGEFYYVMDYISGRSLEDVIEDVTRTRQLPPVRDTLKSFVKICEAMSVAHLRGVIHRDLKPANIRIDASGEPMVVDFGLAKVVLGESGSNPHSADTARAMSMTGQFIGSLPWASPEQAEGHPEAVDVRTDVYALGVMLYQWLTGRFPYDVAGAMRDVLDNIIRADPARPSTVRRQINDEVETIVLKCLQKDRDRRYQSAGELARDIHRYLRGEPIEAKRDRGWYVLGKTLRRHRSVVTTAVAVVAVVAGAIIGLSLLYARAHRAEQAAEARATEVTKALAEARTASARADRVQAFLTQMLRSVEPSRAGGSEPTILQALDVAASRVEADLADEPLVLASVQDLLGTLYFELGQAERSEPLLRAALHTRQSRLPAGHVDVARSLVSMAWLQRNQRKYEDAEAHLAPVLANPALPAELRARALLLKARIADQIPERHAEAERVFGETIGIADGLSDRDGRTLAALARWHLALLLINTQRADQARPLLDRASEIYLALGDQLGQAKVMLRVSTLDRVRQQYPQAIAATKGAIELMASAYRGVDDHPDLLAARSALAAIYYAMGDFAQASSEFEAICRLADAAKQPQNKVQGPVYHASLGSCLTELGRFDEAERELLSAFEAFKASKAFPAEEARTIGRLVKLYERWNRPEMVMKYRAMMPPSPATAPAGQNGPK